MSNHQSPCYEKYNESYDHRQEVVLQWRSFLERWEWDWFCTFTFRDHVHPEKADKAFRVLMVKINRALYGSHFYKHPEIGVRWVRAIELQRRGVLHYHALLGAQGLKDLRRLAYMDKWDELAGFARIEAIRSPLAVMRYVSKYVLKAGGGEIDLGGPLRNEIGPLLKSAVGFDSPESHQGIQGGRKPAGVSVGLPGQVMACPGALH